MPNNNDAGCNLDTHRAGAYAENNAQTNWASADMESPVVPPSGTIRRASSGGGRRLSQQTAATGTGIRCLHRSDSDTQQMDAPHPPDRLVSAELYTEDEPPPKLACNARPSHVGPFVVTVVGTRTTGSMLFKQLPDDLYQCLLSSIYEPVVLSPVLTRCDRRALFVIAIRARVAGHKALEQDHLAGLLSAATHVPVADILQCVTQATVILPADHCQLMARTIVVHAHYE